MSEPPKRQSTRQRKPPKFRQMVEGDFGMLSQGKVSDPKDPISSAQETKQLAKLLTNLINSANQKAKDIQKENNSQLPLSQNQSKETEFTRNPLHRSQDSKQLNTSFDGLGQAGRVPRDADRCAPQSVRPGNKTSTKKGDGLKKGVLGVPSSIQSDLSYHAMLGQHIRSSLPDSKNLSAEMLMQLGLPSKQTIEQSKSREGDKKKKGVSGVQNRLVRQSGAELKPFKRQSYHVAIAYHIYLKQIKTVGPLSPRDIDPTYNARRLRDQNQKQN